MSAEHPTDPPKPDENARASRRLWSTPWIVVAAGIGLAGILNAQPLLSANDRSRWCTVVSLVHFGTYQIDEVIRYPGWDTVDKVRHEGHFYSSKPPLLSTLVAGGYWCVRRTTGWDFFNHPLHVARTLLIAFNLLPMLAALVCLSRMLQRYAKTDFSRAFAMATAAVGTFLTTFLVTLNNHTVAAVCVVFAVFAALRIVANGSRSGLHFASAGFFAAFACSNELPAALFGVALFGLLCRQSLRKTLVWFVPAALVPLAAFFITTYLQTGGWKPFYMYYGTEKYRYVHEGVPSYWMEPKGLDKNVDSTPAYLLHSTVGHHGIFSLSPVFLLSVAGWLMLRRWKDSPLRPMLWLGQGLTVAVLAFYLSRTENYNYGGNTAGLRWTFWLIPFWLLAMVPPLDAWGNRRGVRAAAGVLLAVSIFSALSPLRNPWQHPWLFVLMQDEWGWIDYSDPPPQFPSRRTWIKSLPKESGAWVEFAGVNPDGSQTRLRLTDAGRTEENGRTLHHVEVRWNPGRSSERVKTFSIDEELYLAGEDPEAFLRWPEGTPASVAKQAAAFLRGVPYETKPFQPREVRYLKTPLRTDAFRTIRATAWSALGRAEDQRRKPTGWSARCDVWFLDQVPLGDDVPFGVVQFETSITQPGEVHSRRRLIAVKASTVVEE